MKKKYVTIPAVSPREADAGVLTSTQAADANARVDLPSFTPPTTVVYTIEDIAGRGSNVLVAGIASPLKRTVKLLHAAGATVFTVATADKERAFSITGAATPVCIESLFSKEVFASPYHRMKAALMCGAEAILIPEATAFDAETADLAAAEGIDVFVPYADDHTLRQWVAVKPRTQSAETALFDDIEWTTCPHCKAMHRSDSLADSGFTCIKCGALLRMTSAQRIDAVCDCGSFEEWDSVCSPENPLDFDGYPETLQRARNRSGLDEAVRCGTARIANIPVAIAVMDSTFMMGSMGSVVGHKIAHLVEGATKARLPLVIFTASGGARMQEGLASLMQMARISAAIARHGDAGLFYAAVLTDPTTGGVTASFAMQGDIIVAEPNALIGFAGRRVIQDTIRATLPDGFQTAEFALEHGLIDDIVARGDLRAYLAHALALHAVPDAEEGTKPLFTYASVCENLRDVSTGYPTVSGNPQLGIVSQIAQAAATHAPRMAALPGTAQWRKQQKRDRKQREHQLARATGAVAASAKLVYETEASTDAGAAGNAAWESVQLARNLHRPTAATYIEALFDGFIEAHGDRAGFDDGAIMCGVGWFHGRAVTVIAEEKGADLQQRIDRNFGCPRPEGYRKSLRALAEAEKFNRPVICLVDTQGAYCGPVAEEHGIGNAIAENLVAFSRAKVPVVSVVLGEGGSGGALALAVANKVAMQQHAVYSVLSPEGFASILWKDGSRAPEAAKAMRMSAEDALSMGVVDAVIPEAGSGAHDRPSESIGAVDRWISTALEQLDPLSADELVDLRYRRYAAF